MKNGSEQYPHGQHDGASIKKPDLEKLSLVGLAELNGSTLSLKIGDKVQRLGITEQTAHYVTADFNQTKFLLSQLGLLHLLAGPMPEKVTVDYPLTLGIQHLIKGMYKTENLEPPQLATQINFNNENNDYKTLTPQEIYNQQLIQQRTDKIVVAFSGGKDSLWNMMWAIEQVGVENVLAVHIEGINKTVASFEAADSRLQADKLGFQLEVIKLDNRSSVKNRQVMRSRDMLIMALVAPYAVAFGSSRLVMEGGLMAEADMEPNQPFNYKYWAWQLFNQILEEEWGLPVQVEWQNRSEMESLQDLIEQWPSAVEMISNCFAPKVFRSSIRQHFAEQTPHFLLSNENQCNGCPKCRKVRLAQACFSARDSLSANEVRIFLEDTKKWAKKNQRKFADFIDESFWQHLEIAQRRWG